MSTTAPICTGDTIRVIMQNELGHEGQVCLEYVNKNNDLIVNIIPNSPVLCQPTGTTSLTIIPTSSGGSFKYEWITPDKQVLTIQVIQAAVPGRYLISVRDGNVCIDTASIVVQADTPAIKLTGTSAGSTTNPGCLGAATGSIDLTPSGETPSGTSTYTYIWSNRDGGPGSASQDLAGIVAGIYSVTVTDANGCRTTAAYTLTQPTALSLTTTAQNPACFGTATGSITTTATGGTNPFSYKWNTGAVTQNLTSLIAGTYSVTLTDAQRCSLVQSVTLTNPPALSVATTAQNPACFGANTGLATSTPSSGTGPYGYLWNNGIITQNLANVGAGTYVITMTDANGCSRTATATLTNPPAIALAISTQNAACSGAATGSIDLTPTGGTGVFSYKWTTRNAGPDATTQDLTGIASGVYSVTVTDANSCTAVTQATIQEPSSLTLTLTPRPVNCFGGSNGQVSLTVQGGTGLYTYLWSNSNGGPGASTSAISGLIAGAYSVTVTDGNGYRSMASATVSQPTAL